MSFQEAMRRVITGDNETGKSVVILDGGPASEINGALFEIWQDAASGPLDPRLHTDLGSKKPVLGPPKGGLQVGWFVINPSPEGVPKEILDGPSGSGSPIWAATNISSTNLATRRCTRRQRWTSSVCYKEMYR